MKTVCCIPARLASTRFPRKVLALLGGKPLIERTWERAMSTELFDDVVIAVDAEETRECAESFGARTIMTAPSHVSGTDRLIEVASRYEGEFETWVNWQADEPFVTERMIADLLSGAKECDIATLSLPLLEGAGDPNIVKVVVDSGGRALYFSRSPIPHGGPWRAHVGLYAYSAEVLKTIERLPPSRLEQLERLEQLRYLEAGLLIVVKETAGDPLGIDTPEDLAMAEARLIDTAIKSIV